MRTDIEIFRIVVIDSECMNVTYRTQENPDGAVVQWYCKEMVEALQGIATRDKRIYSDTGKLGGLKIPASAEIGSDRLHDVSIKWEKRFRWKSRILAQMVLEG